MTCIYSRILYCLVYEDHVPEHEHMLTTVMPGNYPDYSISSPKLYLTDPNYLNNGGDSVYYN